MRRVEGDPVGITAVDVDANPANRDYVIFLWNALAESIPLQWSKAVALYIVKNLLILTEILRWKMVKSTIWKDKLKVCETSTYCYVKLSQSIEIIVRLFFTPSVYRWIRLHFERTVSVHDFLRALLIIIVFGNVERDGEISCVVWAVFNRMSAWSDAVQDWAVNMSAKLERRPIQWN